MHEPSVTAQNVLTKQPTEDWVFTMPFGRILAGLTIASVAAVRVYKGTWPTAPHTTAIADPANPTDATDLTLEDTDVSGNDVLLRFSGGVHDRDYYIEVDVTTTSGLVRGADGWLLCRDYST